MYNFHNKQHPMESSGPASSYHPALHPHLEQTDMGLANGWPDVHPRYSVGSVHGFAHEVPKNVPRTNVLGTPQPAQSRDHFNSYSSERSTVQPFQQQWTSPTLSPSSIHSPALTATSASSHIYQNSFNGRSSMEMDDPTSSDWNQWSESTNSDVIGIGRSNVTSSMTQWPNNGHLRVPSFAAQPLDDILYTGANTNSPAYPVSNELPGMPSRGYTLSPFSSPSPSPSVSSCKTSPRPKSSPKPSSPRGSVDVASKKCSHCNATSTPLWRREPTTLKPLCNACGLYLQQRHKHRPQELIDADAEEGESEDESDQNYNGPECSHCHTHRTSVWRRSKTGAQLCNACGVYARLRGKDRPLSLKRKKIKPRTKHASISKSSSP